MIRNYFLATIGLGFVSFALLFLSVAEPTAAEGTTMNVTSPLATASTVPAVPLVDSDVPAVLESAAFGLG
jgi:hypothetical protein